MSSQSARSRFVEAMRYIIKREIDGFEIGICGDVTEKMRQAVEAFADVAFYQQPGHCTPEELVGGIEVYRAALIKEVFGD